MSRVVVLTLAPLNPDVSPLDDSVYPDQMASIWSVSALFTCIIQCINSNHPFEFNLAGNRNECVILNY